MSELLPMHLTKFIGRVAELDEVSRLLVDHRLLTLTGAGGVGKTRLAVKSAEQLAQSGGIDVWFVDLASVIGPSAVPIAVSRAVGVPDQPMRSAADNVCQSIGARHALMVFDNCEHLLEACSQLVIVLLRGCPELKVLATSREPLGVAGEVTKQVAPLSVSHDAIELFVDRARLVHPEFRIEGDAAAQTAVAEICRRLDGIPLAVELAAARVRALSLTEILDGLNDRFRLLIGPARTAVPRQQTLRESVDWSYALLCARERILLHRLAVFPGGFDIEAAQAVAADREVSGGQVRELLTLLVGKSLVVADTTAASARYRLLETVRQYAQEKLGLAGEDNAIRNRHRDYYASIAARLGRPGTIALDTLLARAESEFGNLRTAFTWSRDCADADAALDLASSLAPLWLMRGRIQEGLSWFDTVFTDSTVDRSRIDPRILGRALADYAALGSWSGMPAALGLAEDALDIARDLADPALLTRALASRSGAAVYNADTAGPYLTEAIDAARLSNDGWRLSQTLAWQAFMGIASGYPTPARADALEGTALASSIGDGFVSRQCRTWLGSAYVYAGDLAAATTELRRVVSDGEAAGDGIARVIGSIVLGFSLAYQGDAVGARRAADAALEESAALGGFNQDSSYAASAQAALAAGDVAAAGTACDAAWNARVPSREVFLLGITPLALSAFANGDVPAARRWADETIARTTGWHRMMAFAVRARIAMAQREADQVECDSREALVLGDEIGSVLAVPDLLECLGELRAAGRPREAARLFGAAAAQRHHSGIARCPIWRESYASTVNDIRNKLGDSMFDVAWDEGFALPIDEATAFARHGLRKRKRPDAGWESLTRAEHEVAMLIGEGLANKAVAARLFVSPRTVQTHLSHIYAKLGLDSRLQLAKEVARHA